MGRLDREVRAEEQLTERADGQEVASGFLVVRASGASAALRALGGAKGGEPDRVQLLMRCPIPAVVAESGSTLRFPDSALHLLPVSTQDGPGGHGVVMLTVSTARLSLSFGELRPLMFQPVAVDAVLQKVFAGAIEHLLAAAPALDPHGIAHHLLGLAELVLRSALRTELDRADVLGNRRREAIDYIKTHLAEPGLCAERIADALFISRRRLYQLFDDGDGVSGRIRALRVERAKALLGDPAKASQGIGEIAKNCGFTNAAHFSRTFRKVVGATPREYRDRELAGR
ncbi:helix-turn-helix transcriptional regulator [Amycolatopsis anabasis]|uniref:helix-turn-helix transcriptional regulator n=1 Tax=Amycolatopsis anabasis TaxID=1840409 RepID=UPI0015D22742|nr:AraC family transcriptional regulator [Amycolatopsis anabasis]